MSYDNTNTGALFKNAKKTSENQPDYRGPINVEGVDLEIAAWLKTSKKGEKFMSLKVGPKWEPKEQGEPKPAPDFDDDLDLPF